MKYKVIHLIDNVYQVVEMEKKDSEYDFNVVFQGSLADCEAFIRLNKEGYMDF